MRRAIDETERRRHKQQDYNEKHGITPQGVVKRIKDIIDAAYDMDAERKSLHAAQTEAKYLSMSENEVAMELARLEKEMLQAAKNLEFERAAELRDQLRKLRESVFISPL